MKVLVACEFSGIVRDAFIKRGHDAWSCDLLPTDNWSKYHIKDDVRYHLQENWDLLIAFPPCIDLCVSGARWFKNKKLEQCMSVVFFMMLANAPINKICIENPVGIMSTLWRKPDQIIQPFEYGHPETKKTCLWLMGLPQLKSTNNVYKEMMKLPKKERSRIHYMSPSKNRSKLRSITYQGIADAMAAAWG